MFIYSYVALNTHNQIIEDTLLAKSKKSAFIIISENNLIPLKIKIKAIFNLNRACISYQIHFFHQLGILTSSGITLIQSLKILSENCHLPFWNNFIRNLIQHIEKGELFSDFLKDYQQIFSSTVISLVIVAEKTGTYDENFNTISFMLEHNEKISVLFKKAIRYPLTLCLFSGMLLCIMFLYVIPQFKDIYDSFQQELPLLTQIMLYLSDFIKNQFTYFLLFVSFISILTLRMKKNHRSLLLRVLIQFPIFKHLISYHYLSLYFLTVSSTYKIGLPLIECLDCTIKTINNEQYKKDCENILSSVLKGESLSNAMKETILFPSLAIQLIAIAEESGKLHYFTSYLFKYYSEQYMFYIEKKMKTLEPVLLVFISLLVGMIMLSMYLPIFNLGNVVTGL
ncbi:type II secretion system F family protein [Providencia rettgeri]|uniref:type II secretion system F family protein n=1 Tax=Providencia rettgeri TaxID=587 RepID=UPI002362E2A9|nr:type II secretion system F family protein [Providencia rettgeri]